MQAILWQVCGQGRGGAVVTSRGIEAEFFLYGSDNAAEFSLTHDPQPTPSLTPSNFVF